MLVEGAKEAVIYINIETSFVKKVYEVCRENQSGSRTGMGKMPGYM